MAQPERTRPRVIRWHYTGQTKMHVLNYNAALHSEYAAQADRENADKQDALSEYAGACETGTAVVVYDSWATT